MDWKRLLGCVTGSEDAELLLRNDHLATENRIWRNQLQGRFHLSDAERISLAVIGERLGRKALAEVAQVVRPETIRARHPKLVARKFDGSKNRSGPGRPSTPPDIEALVLRLARDNLQRQLTGLGRRKDGFGGESGWEGCSGSTAVKLHEFFNLQAARWCPRARFPATFGLARQEQLGLDLNPIPSPPSNRGF